MQVITCMYKYCIILDFTYSFQNKPDAASEKLFVDIMRTRLFLRDLFKSGILAWNDTVPGCTWLAGFHIKGLCKTAVLKIGLFFWPFLQECQLSCLYFLSQVFFIYHNCLILSNLFSVLKMGSIPTISFRVRESWRIVLCFGAGVETLPDVVVFAAVADSMLSVVDVCKAPFVFQQDVELGNA